MRLFFALWFFLIPGLLFGATGDVSVTVRPDGYSAIVSVEGFTTGTARHFGYRGRMRATATTGTVQVGETLLQNTSNATCIVTGKYGTFGSERGLWLVVKELTGTALATTAWIGQTSSASFTPETTPSMTEPHETDTPYLTVTALGNLQTVSTNATRRINFTEYMRTPYSASTIPVSGSVTGTLADGETLTQTGTSATCIVVGNQSTGPVWVKTISASPAHNGSGVWTGAAGSFTPSNTATTLAASSYDEKLTATGIQILVALDQQVYAKENTGGGNSGVACTFTAPAGWIVNAGGASQSSNAASAAAVTNSSAATYPQVIFQWDHIAGVCMADMVTGDFDVAGNARSTFPEWIDCVKYTATGATSGATYTTTVYSQKAVAADNGLYLNAYVGRILVSGFTTGEVINLRAQVYPRIGDSAAVLDTDNFTTANDEILGCNKSFVVYNSTPKYAYIDLVSGNNANTGSTTKGTAIASPIQHIGKAIQNDCTVIYLKAGQTHPAIGTASATRRTTNEWYVVQPEDGATYATTTVQLTTTSEMRCQRLMYQGVTMTVLGSTSHIDGENADNWVRLKRCYMNSTQTPSRSFAWRARGAYVEDCWGNLSANGWALKDNAGERNAMQFDGCQFVTSAGTSVANWFRVARMWNTDGVHFGLKTSNSAPTQENCIFEHNVSLNNTGNGIFLSLGSTTAISRGMSIMGNLIERTTSGNPIFHVAGDSSTVAVDTILFACNGQSGDRNSIGYSDIGTTSTVYRRNWMVTGNDWEVLGTKHDTFSNNSLDGRRIGAWMSLYGVNWSGNYSPQLTALPGSNSFLNEVIGKGSFQSGFSGTNQPRAGTGSALGIIGFVNRKTYDGSASGAGGSDLHLRYDSPAVGHMLTPVLIADPYDLNGNPRTMAAAGAYAWGQSRVNPSGTTTARTSGTTTLRR